MPWLFFLFVILGIVSAGLSVIARSSDIDTRRTDSGIVAVVCAIAALLLLGLSSVTVVSTRNVGVLTSFGRPEGTLSNGIHFKIPWQKKHELNGTIQTNWQRGGFENDKCSGGTAVRLANNSTACLDNSIRWRIKPGAADALFRDYQNDTNIRVSLVTRALEASLNTVFAGYDPLSPGAVAGPNLADLSRQATDQLRARTGAQIEVLEIIISLVHFDARTERGINTYQTELTNKRTAEARQETATAEAQANKNLAESLSRDPNVLVSRCLDMLNAGKPFPGGFQCWPNTALPMTIPVG